MGLENHDEDHEVTCVQKGTNYQECTCTECGFTIGETIND